MRRFAMTVLCVLALCRALPAQESHGGFWMDLGLSTGEVMGGVSYGDVYKGNTDYAAHVILGYRLGPHLAIGAGTAVSRMIKSDVWSFPLTVKVQYDILDAFFSPYLSAEVGWSLRGGPVFRPVTGEDEDPDPLRQPANYAYHREGLHAALGAGISLRTESTGRFYLGANAGVCSAVYGVLMREEGGKVVCRGPDGKATGSYRPELRFMIGFEF